MHVTAPAAQFDCFHVGNSHLYDQLGIPFGQLSLEQKTIGALLKRLSRRTAVGRRDWDRTSDHFHVKEVLYH